MENAIKFAAVCYVIVSLVQPLVNQLSWAIYDRYFNQPATPLRGKKGK